MTHDVLGGLRRFDGARRMGRATGLGVVMLLGFNMVARADEARNRARAPLANREAVADLTDADRHDVAEAKEHYKKGTKAFDLGAYDEAVNEYSLAYRLRDDPALLYNLGQAHRLAQHPAEALRFYRLFLLKLPNASNRAEVQEKVAELQRLVEQQKRTQNMPPDSVKQPGPASQPVGANARPTTEASSPPVAVGRATGPNSEMTSARRSARTKVIAGATTAAGGLVLVVGGIVSGVLAKQASDKLTRLDQTNQPFDYRLEQSGKTALSLEGVFLGIGAAAVVAGGVVLYLGYRQQRREQKVSFTPIGTTSPAGAGLRRAF